MSNPKFLKKESLTFGWSKAKIHVGFFVKVFAVMMVVPFLMVIITKISEGMFKDQATITGLIAFIVFIIGTVWQMITNIGLNKISLKITNNESVEVKNLYTGHNSLIVKYFIGMILYTLIVMGGMMLFVIPGIIWAIKYSQYYFLIIDQNLSPIESLKKSAEITSGAKSDLFLFGILICLINFLGMFCLLIGLLWTGPLTVIAQAYVYRKLMSQTGNVPQPQQAVPAPVAPPPAVKI